MKKNRLPAGYLKFSQTFKLNNPISTRKIKVKTLKLIESNLYVGGRTSKSAGPEDQMHLQIVIKN